MLRRIGAVSQQPVRRDRRIYQRIDGRRDDVRGGWIQLMARLVEAGKQQIAIRGKGRPAYEFADALRPKIACGTNEARLQLVEHLAQHVVCLGIFSVAVVGLGAKVDVDVVTIVLHEQGVVAAQPPQ